MKFERLLKFIFDLCLIVVIAFGVAWFLAEVALLPPVWELIP